MSMAKCKCDYIFDTDDQLGFDEKGECCCDNCFEEMSEELDKTIRNYCEKIQIQMIAPEGIGAIESIVEKLMDEGYRKVR